MCGIVWDSLAENDAGWGSELFRELCVCGIVCMVLCGFVWDSLRKMMLVGEEN